MARIITINPLKYGGAYRSKVGIPEWIPDNCTISINLETVCALSCTRRPNRMYVKKENLGFWAKIFGDEYEMVEGGTFFELGVAYKNNRGASGIFPISPEEYERLKPELAKYGWHI